MSIQSDKKLSRRAFVQKGSRAAAGLMAGAVAATDSGLAFANSRAESGMRFGLVTYQWGRDWDVPAIIRNCTRAGAYGVELRVDHAHGVSPDLTGRERYEVKLRFDGSPVELVGLGTNFAFHYPDEFRVRMNVEGAKEWVRLSHDVGGTGVKVKPNGLPEGVPVEKTVEQIGRSLNELGRYAADYGQEIRVEVHGPETQQLPVIAQIMEVADHPCVVVCWNCNDEDLDGAGLEHNFELVKDRFGDILHAREFDVGAYPYPQLFALLTKMDYDGWILMEARTEPMDRIDALAGQRALYDALVKRAKAACG